jgi:FkbM family methyltransferase
MAHIGKVLLNGFIKLLINKKWRKEKYIFFFSYCKYALKYAVSWKLLHIPLRFEQIHGFKLKIFHYSILLSLFEDMFLNDEYYVTLRRHPTIVDLGSEVGLSVTYFATTYPNSQILAFEPDPASFALLRHNINANRMKNVTAFNYALSDKVGILPFYVDSKVEGSLTMSLYPTRQQRKITVKVKRLSSFLTRRIDLLKMDIEGAELSVLTDLVKSRKISLISHMIIEYHHHIDPYTNNLSVLLGLLERTGFGYQIQAKNPTPFEKRKFQDCLIFAYKM